MLNILHIARFLLFITNTFIIEINKSGFIEVC